MLTGFSSALEEFFNGTSEKEAIASSVKAGSLVDALDKFITENFDLDKEETPKPTKGADNQKIEVISGNKI